MEAKGSGEWRRHNCPLNVMEYEYKDEDKEIN